MLACCSSAGQTDGRDLAPCGTGSLGTTCTPSSAAGRRGSRARVGKETGNLHFALELSHVDINPASGSGLQSWLYINNLSQDKVSPRPSTPSHTLQALNPSQALNFGSGLTSSNQNSQFFVFRPLLSA